MPESSRRSWIQQISSSADHQYDVKLLENFAKRDLHANSILELCHEDGLSSLGMAMARVSAALARVSVRLMFR
jgi:hypothetical protein